jgi:asparagine N-glycosylation enzyme membrane subunit Stt3
MRIDMHRKKLLIQLTLILAIFLLGFLIRIDSAYIPGVPADEKSFYEDANGLPYMYELDSYYNYRLTDNFINHGYMGDAIINGTDWDLHSYYPPGVPLDYPPLIVYLSTFAYYLVNLFSKTSLLTVIFWLPAFMGPLSGVVAYLLVSRFTNVYGALAAGIFTVTVPVLVVRTVAGYFTTDMFIVLFPLLVTLFYIEAIHSKNIKKQIVLAIMAAFSISLFAMGWIGWTFQFYLMVIFTTFYIIALRLKGDDILNLTLVLMTFFSGTLLLVFVLMGKLSIINLFVGPLELLMISGTQNPWYGWPNVYTTVTELQRPSIELIISGLGLVSLGGILGLFWIFRIMVNVELKKRFLNRMSWFFYTFLVFWTLIGFMSLWEGVRFLMLLVPPMVISSGILIGIVVGYLEFFKGSKRFTIFKRRPEFLTLIAILIIISMTVPAVFSIDKTISTMNPLVNNDFSSASQWIKENTSSNIVIISDWSYGHFFTAMADRPVVMDGRMGYIETLPIRNYDSSYPFGDQSPGISRFYWIDHAFSTTNESLSTGIFQMLSTSGDLAYLTLNNYTHNTSQSVEILNNVLGVNKTVAWTILTSEYHLSDNQADNVLKYTHPDNAQPFVVVTTYGMMDEGGDVFKFGEWDFNKIQGLNSTYSLGEINVDNGSLDSDNGVHMDMKNGNITWNGKIPYSVVTVANGKIETSYLDDDSNFSVLLLMDSNESVVMDKQFDNSLFAKLILEKGNSSYFEPVYSNKNVVIWELKTNNSNVT